VKSTHVAAMDPKIYVATGSDDGLAKVWVYEPDRNDERAVCQATLSGHTAGITSISWNPHPQDDEYKLEKHSAEEEQLLTSSRDQSLKVWKPYARHGPTHRDLPKPDSRYDAEDPGQARTRVPSTKHTDYINSACWRPNGPDMGKHVLSCSDDHTAAVWDVATGERKFRLKTEGVGHTDAVAMATWSPDGNRVLTCSHDQSCIIWSAKNGHHIKLMPSQATKDPVKTHTGPIWSALFSPDGHEVVTASRDKTARVWDCNTGQRIVTLEDPKLNDASVQSGAGFSHNEVVFGATWNPFEPHQILTCSLDGTAKIWDKRDKRKVSLVLDHHTACVWSASFGNDPGGGGRMILTCSHDMSALVYDQRLAMPKNTLLGHTGILWQASFSDDDQYVVTCSEDRTARLWNLSTGARLPPSLRLMDPVHPHKQAVTCAAFRPPGPLEAGK